MATILQALDPAAQSCHRMLKRLFRPAVRVNAAYDACRKYHEVTDADLKDIGLTREDALGIPSQQSDLPFFMQPEFGTRRI